MHRLHTFVRAVVAVAVSILADIPAQQSRQTRFQELRGLVQAGELARTITQARAYVAEDDAFAGGWYWLGVALHSTGNHADAVPAFARAAGFPATAVHAAYNAACACARLGRVDDAFGWLAKAKQAGFGDVLHARNDPDLADLYADARFDALFPPIDQADPFVERGVLIRQDSCGSAVDEQYGWVARRIGDTDGDGVADYAVTAPFAAASAGRVELRSGRTGELRFGMRGCEGDLLGWCVGGAGDLDGDGRADLFVGAPGPQQQSTTCGALVFVSGADGHELGRLRGSSVGERFGASARAVGDQDGDGLVDILVAAPLASVGPFEQAGRIGLYGGASLRRLLAADEPAPNPAPLHRFDGEFAGARLGEGEVAGFVAGERRVLVASTFGNGDPARARVTWWAGDSGEVLHATGGGPGTVNLGWFLSTDSDVNGDGVPDVLATDWHDTEAGAGAGRVWIWSGADGAPLHSLGGRVAGEHFGIGAGDAGDLDGDGCDDLAIGAWQHASGAPSGGRVYLLSGADGAELGRVTGKIPGDTFGFDSTGIGDVDGDGVRDLLVTAAWNGRNGRRSGRVYVLSGASCLVPASAR